jgi:hypothetical protein
LTTGKVTVLSEHVVVGKALIHHGVALVFGHRLPLLLFDVSKANVFHISLLIGGGTGLLSWFGGIVSFTT